MPTSPEIISNTDTKLFSIVRLSKDNLEDVAKLHAAVYGVAVNKDFFYKKYDTAYTGTENIGFIAYGENGQPVAYYGVIPCLITFNNQHILAAQSADTMTHPQYRYKGMFVELSNITFDLCRQSGILLIFGFPNQNSYHGAVTKLGWKPVENMACFIIPVNSLPLEYLAKRISFLNPLYKKYTQFVLAKKTLAANGVKNSVIADGFAGIYRTEGFLKYKTYSPSSVIEIDNAKIWFNNKHGIMLGDMEGVNEGNFAAVIRSLKSIAKKTGVKQLQFHCSPGTKLHQLFAEQFQSIPSYPILYQDFGSVIPPEKLRFTFSDLDIF